ncbi:hypothetical protein L1D36_27480, partial [Vibrio mediterranei]|nr:hypothetical protein [Vibrio mediterranei]
MHNSNIENTIKKSNWISIGFVSVVIIIASIGITAWISLNKLFIAVERYDGASQFLLALDKAHLQELSYTRNLTESAASEAMRSLDEAIVLVKGMESSSANYNEATKSIERQLVRYQSNFKAYVNLRREDEQAKRIMLVQAQQASKLVDEFLSLQIDYINTDTQLVGKLYFELSENSRLTTSIRSLLSSVYLIRQYAKYEVFNQANVVENQLSILTSIFEEISDLETNNNDEIILNNLHQVRGLSNAYQYTLLELADEQQGKIDIEKASREELDYLASKMLNLSEILQKRQKLR